MKSRYCVFSGILVMLLLLMVTPASFGQNDTKIKTSTLDTPEKITARQLDYIHGTYSSRVEVPHEFINGKEYEAYYLRSKSKPLLLTDKERTATIFTKTRKYNKLTLQYDTFLDEVIYTDTSRTINFRFPQIALNKDIVEGFNLYIGKDSLVFRYFRQPECATKKLAEGFYEIAYLGKSEYVIRHTSSFYVREGLNEYKYSPENYISMGDSYYRIKSKGNLLKLFGDKSDEMKKFMHMAHIRIKQADKSQFVSILRYYDSLLTSSR
jgi:hypothetical protein